MPGRARVCALPPACARLVHSHRRRPARFPVRDRGLPTWDLLIVPCSRPFSSLNAALAFSGESQSCFLDHRPLTWCWTSRGLLGLIRFGIGIDLQG